jgi:hypothetical protein
MLFLYTGTTLQQDLPGIQCRDEHCRMRRKSSMNNPNPNPSATKCLPRYMHVKVTAGDPNDLISRGERPADTQR